MSEPMLDPASTPQGRDPVANRLLRSYAPIALLALVLIAVAALVPTAPEVRSADDAVAEEAVDGDEAATSDTTEEKSDVSDNTPLVVGSLVLLALIGTGLFLYTRRGAASAGGGANAPPATGGVKGFFAPANRLFAGYGPLVVLAALILVMAVAVPTLPVDPEELSAGETTDPGSGFLTPEGPSTADPSDPDTSDPDTAGSDTGSQPAAEGPGAGSVGTDGQGSGVAPVAGVAACADGRTEQIPGDPYSPPCVQWDGGNNGGATATGVTADKIVVAYRVLAERGFQQTLASLAGASLSDTPESIKRTISALADYFNQRFEFYGRNIEMAFYDGRGSTTNELLGKGREKAVADATQVASMGAFADLSAVSEPYADALADRGIVGFGTPYLSRQWHEARAPYAWSFATDGTRVSELAAEYSNKRLQGKNAVYAEGDLKGKPRQFAIIAPDNSWYQESVANAQRIITEAGNPAAMEVAYQLDLGKMSDQANAIIPKLKNAGITTITCGCDPILPVFLSGAATRASYFPEFIIAGTALTDTDIVGQLWEPAFAKNAFGISALEPFVPPEQTIGYAAFKSVRPNEEPAFSIDIIYYQMYMLAIGIQGAGPNLTPQSLSDGLFNYPARLGPVGMWQFGPGDRTAANDVREVYFDINAISGYNGKKGSYLGTTGERWEAGEIPPGEPGVPDL